ncbi:trehalase [Holotrichia oblita]|uniref:Trehalase n=1 Tax=Holotrichia oblita TaxID=644536 RepID=A0ACB9SNZ5_HOLOL|nr:trehalase [Holotrichia oblita]
MTMFVTWFHYFILYYLLTCVCVSVSALKILQPQISPTCDSEIYCQGDLLRTVQMSQIFNDSKTFVDMSLKRPPAAVLNIFKDLMKNTDNTPTQNQLKNFISDNFESGTELERWIPPDFNPKPAFLSKIIDPRVAEFAQRIVMIWQDLGRKVKEEVFQNPELHSLIPIPNGLIIPGGRFNEYYYWDYYWILEGLIVCEMFDTVRGIIDNFFTIVKKYNFIPNGGRVYYSQRSQPPMLTFMAKNYFQASKNLTWLSRNIEYLSKEVEFWINERLTKITVNGREYDIGVYFASSEGPRPESYREDISTASTFTNQEDKQNLYNELKAAAQSGWDFSSRWIFDANGGNNANLSFTQTTRVAPVDLNSYLYGAFYNMAAFYSILGNNEKKRYWKSKAARFLTIFRDLFWNENDGTWYDFDIELKQQRKFFAASNLTPMWVSAYHKQKNKQTRKVIRYLRKEGVLNFPGGIPATKIYTGQQWDYPNCFPPLQSIIIEGLNKSGYNNAQILAQQLAKKWVEANIIGEETHGVMFEKYHAQFPGQYGHGGEYKVQKGFGWTNGVVLDFINKYYTEINVD